MKQETKVLIVQAVKEVALEVIAAIGKTLIKAADDLKNPKVGGTDDFK